MCKLITIRQVMIASVATVRTGATVEETIECFTRNHIESCPVVDDEGQLAGLVSEFELIDVVFDESVKSALVSKYMNAHVKVVHPDEPLTRVAQLFALYDFHRLPVVENGKLIGIISRRDLMNYTLRTNMVLADPLMALIPSLAPMS